jgi:uncharacterized protein
VPGMRKAANQRATPSRAGPTAALAGLELDTRRAVRVRTVEALRGGRTPLALVAAADDAAGIAEAAVRKAERADPPPPRACREGCDWCCHLPVGTSAAEVIRIVQYLRQTLPPDEFRALRERVVRLAEQRRALPAADRGRSRLPCGLLADHRCSAYAVRPLTCRGFNSSDAARCEQFVTAAGKTAVPLYGPQLRMMTFALDGMGAGLSESGLKGERLELTAALCIALEVPGSVEQFLAGAPAFAAARYD